MLESIFKRTITLDEKMFTEICEDIEKELRQEISKEYRDKMKAIDFKSYKTKVEYSNMETKYIELLEAYDILQSKYMSLEEGINKKNTNKDRCSDLAKELFGNDG